MSKENCSVYGQQIYDGQPIKRQKYDSDAIAGPSISTVESSRMANCKCMSHCIVLSNLGWRNDVVSGGKGKNFSAKMISNAQYFPYTGFQDSGNSFWAMRGWKNQRTGKPIADYGPVFFKD